MFASRGAGCTGTRVGSAVRAKSYGFRPGRGCHDAIGAIYCTLNGKKPQRVWVLDADLTAAFDRIDHDRLMAALGTFPARGLVGQWLKAGAVDRGRFAPTEAGTPQGRVISPLLFNVALHGMEEAAGVRYYATGRDAGSAESGSPVLVRYADDFVAMCTSREQAEQVKQRLREWLTPRGLAFHEDKTRIVHAESGFDFLGFSVRRYHGKLLIKPSAAAQRRIRERLSTVRGARAVRHPPRFAGRGHGRPVEHPDAARPQRRSVGRNLGAGPNPRRHEHGGGSAQPGLI